MAVAHIPHIVVPHLPEEGREGSRGPRATKMVIQT